jgi:hypothetical protein
MSSAGKKILAALQEAVAGNLARVTVDGVTWFRKEELGLAEGRAKFAEAQESGLRAEVARLRAAILSAEIAITRDGDSDAAAQILIRARDPEL